MADVYTKLLLHCNGEDESTSFPDSSSSEHTIAPIGTAQVDTTIKELGSGSVKFLKADWLDSDEHADWSFGTDDWTIDFWMYRSGSQASYTGVIGASSSGLTGWEIDLLSNTPIIWTSSGGWSQKAAATDVIADVTWTHVALVRNGNSLQFYINGTASGSASDVTGQTFNSGGVGLTIGASRQVGSLGYTGYLDEIRISKGIARWTSNFTPPTEEYGDLSLSIEESVSIDDTWQLQTNPALATLDDTATIDDTWQLQTNPVFVDIVETLTLSDDWSISTVEKADYISSIISINPLIFVTDTNPAKIFKVDITDPTNPIVTGTELIGVQGAKAVAYNATSDFLYVACETGKVVKVDFSDLSIQTVIDLSDTDNLLTIDTLDDFSISYTSTDNAIGELYLIDEQDAAIIDNDFQYLQEIQTIINNQFHYLDEGVGIINNDFQYLQTDSTLINNDFKYIATDFSQLVPIAQTDFHVFINNVELGNTDVNLSSISIIHTVGEQSEATFKLNRRHDNINETLGGSTVVINNQNTVKIIINGITEFDGIISNLNCVGQLKTEGVIVSALMDQPESSYNNINLPLASLDEQFSLYHIKMEDLNIYNPYIDPSNEDDPKLYKGVRVDLGTEIKESLSRIRFLGNTETLADSIQNGTFLPYQNLSYFWMVNASKPNVTTSVTSKAQQHTDVSNGFLPKFNLTTFELSVFNLPTFNIEFFTDLGFLRYVGTSLGSMTSDIWNLESVSYYQQRLYEDIQTELGFYTVGSAPFKDISVRNGKKISRQKWVDEDDGLYNKKDAGYNFVEYAKIVAELEYDKMTNINGNILPQTTVNIDLTVDAYLYYNINLLSRIAISNTIDSGIYKDENGFPVSVKSIIIRSSDLSISLTTDNLKSVDELEAIDGQYPDEDSNEFNFEEESSRIYKKFDPNYFIDIE